MKPKRRTPQTNLDYWVKNPDKKPRTYVQQWHEYNLAQTNEKIMFLDILRDLCNYIKYRKLRRKGRPTLEKSDMIFCMCLAIYQGKSSRRTISELRIAKDRELIEKVPHFNTLLNYYNNEELTKHLKKLIQLSSYPLKQFEQDFTVDSSGFSTSQFHRWFDHKWGKEKQKRKWMKAHIMSGVRTNIVTSVEITNLSVGDPTPFPDLVNETSQIFQMREVSADMAYSSRNSLSAVSNKGAIPYIPFKSNAVGKSRGCQIWGQMFKYFKENYDEYMEHYHKRSNAETVFSMIKKKFDLSLRSKTEKGQINELLCKVLCHNICVLIHEIFELGISTDFEEHYTRINYAEERFAQKRTI